MDMNDLILLSASMLWAGVMAALGLELYREARRGWQSWRVRRSDAAYLRDLEQREWRRGW